MQRLAVARGDRQCLVEARQCLSVAPELLQHESVIAKRISRTRIIFQRGAEEVDRLGGAALLMTDDGEQVAGVEMVGARLQNIAAQLLGFDQPAVALTGGGAIQELGQAQ